MNKSLFLEITDKFFANIQSYVEQVNGKRNTNTAYLFEEMLRNEYSPTQRWDSASANRSNVAADVVALDSSLPVKSLGRITKASGKLPAIGMKLWLSAEDINNLNVMKAQGNLAPQIINSVLDHSVACTNGMKERLEYLFLQALSEGVCAVADSENVGTAIRLDFNYPKANSYGAIRPWGTEGANPIEDLARVLGQHPEVRTIMIAKETYNLLRQSEGAKILTASFTGMAILDKTAIPTPTPKNFNEAFADVYGVEFKVVGRTIYIEKNGQRTPTRPWNKNKVIFLADTKVGALVYGSHPEETNPAMGVAYSKPLPYALLSKYSKNDPLREFTAIQGIVAPIIEGVDQIYSLDISEGITEDKTAEGNDAGDVKITLKGQAYTKAEVIKAFNKIKGTNLPVNLGDGKLIDKINELNSEEEAQLLTAIEAHKA